VNAYGERPLINWESHQKLYIYWLWTSHQKRTIV